MNRLILRGRGRTSCLVCVVVVVQAALAISHSSTPIKCVCFYLWFDLHDILWRRALMYQWQSLRTCMRDFTDQKEKAEWQQCRRMMRYYLVHSQKASCERKKRSHLAAKVHDCPGDYRSWVIFSWSERRSGSHGKRTHSASELHHTPPPVGKGNAVALFVGAVEKMLWCPVKMRYRWANR